MPVPRINIVSFLTMQISEHLFRALDFSGIKVFHVLALGYNTIYGIPNDIWLFNLRKYCPGWEGNSVLNY